MRKRERERRERRSGGMEAKCGDREGRGGRETERSEGRNWIPLRKTTAVAATAMAAA